MLTELCEYLRNWFCEESDKICGTITIGDNGAITVPGGIAPAYGQYIRIIGSVFNDGVMKYGEDELYPETFSGAVWFMRVPKIVINLADEIQEWREKYESVSSPAMSPYNSESFAGYSYSKSNSTSFSDGTTKQIGWQTTFDSRLSPWRKL